MNKELNADDFKSVQGAIAASEAEWQVRVDLAAMFRLTHIMGWDDTIWNHITARVPGTDHTFLMHRFGLLYEEITASNLIKVDEQGNVLEGPPDVNTAGFVIHSAIHLYHPRTNTYFMPTPPQHWRPLHSRTVSRSGSRIHPCYMEKWVTMTGKAYPLIWMSAFASPTTWATIKF